MATKKNGAKPEKPLFRISKLTATVHLDGAYKGAEVEIWSNAPYGLWEDVRENRIDGVELIKQIVVGWNLADDDGVPIPIPAEGGMASLLKLPPGLLLLIESAAAEKIQEDSQVPKASVEP